MTLPAPDASLAGSPADREGDPDSLPSVLAIGCRFDLDASAPTPAVVIVEPHESPRARVLTEQFTDVDGASNTSYVDGFGNRCRRMTLPAGPSPFSYRASVSNSAGFDVTDLDAHEVAVGDLPNNTLAFLLLPSRSCPSDELASIAVERFGSMASGWQRVDAIAAWANSHLTFADGSSSPTAAEASVPGPRSTCPTVGTRPTQGTTASDGSDGPSSDATRRMSR